MHPAEKLTHASLWSKLSRRIPRRILIMSLLFCAAGSGLFAAMPRLFTTPAQQKPATPVADLARDDRVKTALDWLAKNTAWITDEQARITEIPAPSFQEAQRNRRAPGHGSAGLGG
jgi:hypothetical protein